MNYELAKIGIEIISQNPELIKDFDMPNINCKTMGGKIWWRDIAESNGWRIQQNSVTKHCRIIDPDDVRRAWGGEDAMVRLFNKIC